MRIYIVTSGEYSAYGIDAVFLDKRKAIIYARTIHGTVEEYDTCDDNIDENNIYYQYQVRYIPKTGFISICTSVKDVHAGLNLADEYVHIPEKIFNKTTVNEAFEIYWYDKKEYDDKEVIKKIFFDKLTQHRAEEEGIT